MIAVSKVFKSDFVMVTSELSWTANNMSRIKNPITCASTFSRYPTLITTILQDKQIAFAGFVLSYEISADVSSLGFVTKTRIHGRKKRKML